MLVAVGIALPAAADCPQYIMPVDKEANQCGFCKFTGGWEDADGTLHCNYECTWKPCQTV